MTIVGVKALSEAIFAAPAGGTQIGAFYSQANTAAGGGGTYVFSKKSGNLPPGTTLNTTTGLVSGTLAAPAGPFSYSIEATDQFGQKVGAGTAGSTLPPTVTSANPSQGPSAGGQAIIINGSDFGAASSVTVDGIAVGFSVLVPSTPSPNRTQIALTTLPHAPGPVNTVVTTPAGAGTGVGVFTFLPSPTITAISPASGPLIGGQTIVITGSNFDTAPDTTFVTIGGVAATAVVVNSPTQISATTPANAVGPQTVSVTLLIQIHMAALSHANLTGNYSVLHALGSPAFQAANSINQLAANFTIFRTQGIDISQTQLLPPLLFGPPKLEGLDLLRVSGQYDTKPQRVVFEMAFQAVSNTWRLAGIAVKTIDANQIQPGAPGGDQPISAGQAAKAASPNSPSKK